MNYLKIFWHFNALKNDNDRLTYITGQKSSLIIKKINRAKFKIKQYHKIYIINKHILEGAGGAEPLSPPLEYCSEAFRCLIRERETLFLVPLGGGQTEFSPPPSSTCFNPLSPPSPHPLTWGPWSWLWTIFYPILSI